MRDENVVSATDFSTDRRYHLTNRKNKNVLSYLGMQFGDDFSTSHVANSFIASGWSPSPIFLAAFSAIFVKILTRMRFTKFS